MKYTVTSGSQGYEIGTANSIEEAMKLYDAHLDCDPSDDACIWDENNNSVDDWFFFVGEIIDNSDNPDELLPMDSEEAAITLRDWAKDGVEIPSGMTADAHQYICNYCLDTPPSSEEQRREYWECVHADDECEFKAEAREAAAYIPPALRGTDYDPQLPEDDQDEPAEPEEPKMKLTKDQIITLNSMAQTNWEKAQGMLDGMNAILGTKYGWLAKRVVWFENPDGGPAGKYAACHDALAWSED